MALLLDTPTKLTTPGNEGTSYAFSPQNRGTLSSPPKSKAKLAQSASKLPEDSSPVLQGSHSVPTLSLHNISFKKTGGEKLPPKSRWNMDLYLAHRTNIDRFAGLEAEAKGRKVQKAERQSLTHLRDSAALSSTPPPAVPIKEREKGVAPGPAHFHPFPNHSYSPMIVDMIMAASQRKRKNFAQVKHKIDNSWGQNGPRSAIPSKQKKKFGPSRDSFSSDYVIPPQVVVSARSKNKGVQCAGKKPPLPAAAHSPRLEDLVIGSEVPLSLPSNRKYFTQENSNEVQVSHGGVQGVSVDCHTPLQEINSARDGTIATIKQGSNAMNVEPFQYKVAPLQLAKLNFSSCSAHSTARSAKLEKGPDTTRKQDLVSGYAVFNDYVGDRGDLSERSIKVAVPAATAESEVVHRSRADREPGLSSLLASARSINSDGAFMLSEVLHKGLKDPTMPMDRPGSVHVRSPPNKLAKQDREWKDREKDEIKKQIFLEESRRQEEIALQRHEKNLKELHMLQLRLHEQEEQRKLQLLNSARNEMATEPIIVKEELVEGPEVKLVVSNFKMGLKKSGGLGLNETKKKSLTKTQPQLIDRQVPDNTPLHSSFSQPNTKRFSFGNNNSKVELRRKVPKVPLPEGGMGIQPSSSKKKSVTVREVGLKAPKSSQGATNMALEHLAFKTTSMLQVKREPIGTMGRFQVRKKSKRPPKNPQCLAGWSIPLVTPESEMIPVVVTRERPKTALSRSVPQAPKSTATSKVLVRPATALRRTGKNVVPTPETCSADPVRESEVDDDQWVESERELVVASPVPQSASGNPAHGDPQVRNYAGRGYRKTGKKSAIMALSIADGVNDREAEEVLVRDTDCDDENVDSSGDDGQALRSSLQ